MTSPAKSTTAAPPSGSTGSAGTPGELETEFAALMGKERDWIDGRPGGSPPPDDCCISARHVSGEAWVSFTTRDRFGLALSGGGIRSATFNLGLLQALERHDLLRKTDYLSTVSGGGYIGGFATAWRHHHPSDPRTFPMPPEQSEPAAGGGQTAPSEASPPPWQRPPEIREPLPIRHLREFSRFLMPRVGMFQSETWSAVVTILGGMLPSLAAAFSVLVLGCGAWLGLNWAMDRWAAFGAVLLAGVTTLALFINAERWDRHGRATAKEVFNYWLLGGLSALVAWLGWSILRSVGGRPTLPVTLPPGLKQSIAHSLNFLPTISAPQQAMSWLTGHFDLWSMGWMRPDAKVATIGGAFGPATVWLTIVLILLVIRVLASRFADTEGGSKARLDWSGTIDRVIATHLMLALFWSAMALVWLAAGELHNNGTTQTLLGSTTLGSVGLFAWLRDWLKKPVTETNATTLARKVTAALRPKIPQLLAIAAVLLLLVLACGVLRAPITARDGQGVRLVMFGAGVVVLVTLIFFDPARVGMHDFYRARIARCFLGAARASESNFSGITWEQPADDLTLGALAKQPMPTPRDGEKPHRTLHLVCCTANDLSGDVLRSLYRGGRSAVVSPYGIAVGHFHGPLDSLRFSSALTASAAAMNSQMGRISVDFGPAVGFLMSALNLRLGLWVPHPLNPKRAERSLRGLPFFYEMFGRTACDGIDGGNLLRRTLRRFGESGRSLANTFRDLHLSDGGHFDNLALYELVRRHCRYIIVSDCGADPEVIFDDLAIALRTIREDFGVEIDLDVSPLRPDANGRARQHAVVGTIHYNGLSGLDKGTLLYLKPAITGDEPPDVLQYQSRNRAFPHESTGDQFYDEAQWESYRRLGQHSGNVVLRFIDGFSKRRHGQPFLENVFLEATRLWHPAPERQRETFLTLTERCMRLESEIRDHAPAFLRREFFPEVAAASATDAAPADTPNTDDETKALYFLMLVAQLMEDVWMGAELETYWSHPLNDGWMNYFHRWATTPSFRRWWPVLRPIYSIGFRDFVRERFGIGYAENDQQPGASIELRQKTGTKTTGLAWDYWRQRNPAGIPADHEVLEYLLTLDAGDGQTKRKQIIVGVLIYRNHAADRIFEWNSGDLFVPASLNGSGIMARFLTAIIGHFRYKQYRALQVVLDRQSTRIDPATRLSRLHEVNFYKSRGFAYNTPDDQDVRLELSFAPAVLLDIAASRLAEVKVAPSAPVKPTGPAPGS